MSHQPNQARPFAPLSLLAMGVLAAATAGEALLSSEGKLNESIVVCAGALAVAIVLYSMDKTKPFAPVRLAECVLLIWFVSTPLASFYLRVPVERSLLTFDRFAMATVSALLILHRIRRLKRGFGADTDSQDSRPTAAVKTALSAGFRVTPFEALWLLLAAVALINVALKSHNLGYSFKTVIDAFALPLAAFHLARNCFNFERRGRAILLAAMALSFFLFGCGAVELATGWNLFPYKGSLLLRAAEVRVNGPFASDSSHAIISLIIGVFLLQAPRMLQVRFDKSSRLVYRCACAAAIVSSFLPLYRVIPFSLVVCVLTLGVLKRPKNIGPPASVPRAWKRFNAWSLPRLDIRSTALSLSILIAVAGGMAVLSSTDSRLSSPENAFSRLATWQAATRIAADHPLFGVGLSNYSEYLEKEYGDENWSIEEALETRIATTPHSNVLWIASELGVAGLIPYLLANLALLGDGVRVLRRAAQPRVRAGAACYIAMIAAYWIPGLTLTSGAYSDLNLYFLFLLGLVGGFLKRSGGSQASAQSEHSSEQSGLRYSRPQ